MYDELVKQLRNRRICVQQLGTLNDAPLLGEAADAIEELSKLHETQKKNLSVLTDALMKSWIPVTERLPEIHTMVLVMDKAHDMAVGSLEKLWGGEVWVCPFADVEDEQCPVTHWMALPEPPKEE